MEPMLCSVPDAGRALGIKRSKVYSLIAEGSLTTVTIGRRRLVTVASVKALAGQVAA